MLPGSLAMYVFIIWPTRHPNVSVWHPVLPLFL